MELIVETIKQWTHSVDFTGEEQSAEMVNRENDKLKYSKDVTKFLHSVWMAEAISSLNLVSKSNAPYLPLQWHRHGSSLRAFYKYFEHAS